MNFVLKAVLISISIGVSISGYAKKSSRPNIVFILTDDQGYADLSCYGSTDLSTPNIDKLAASGIRLTDFYAGASVCTPTRATILTACYPKRLSLHEGVISPFNEYGLNSEETLLPEILNDNGYTTACIGKWHLGHEEGMLPHEQGFDLFYGVPYSNDMDSYYYGHVDFQSPPLPIYHNDKIVRSGMNQDSLTYTWTQESVKFIKESAKSDNPFFLYLAHNMPHDPWAASEKFKESSGRGVYGDAVQEIDWSVGEVIKALKRSKVYDNTIIVFTSDNGGSDFLKDGGDNTPLRGGKATTWEGGQRVPCIVSWPNEIEEAYEYRGFMSTLDWMPTLLSMCDIDDEPELEIDGVSMATMLMETKEIHDRPFYYYSRSGDIEAVRVGKWKLHIAKERDQKKGVWGGDALYNLESDISESINVADSNPKVVSELKRKMLQFDRELNREMRPTMGSRK